MLGVIQVSAQNISVNKQRKFPKTVPAGNYSGITWLGGNRYAVVDDKTTASGFHLMTILTDSISGDIKNITLRNICVFFLDISIQPDSVKICAFRGKDLFDMYFADMNITADDSAGQPLGSLDAD